MSAPRLIIRHEVDTQPLVHMAGDLTSLTVREELPPSNQIEVSAAFLTRNSSIAMLGGLVSQGLKFLVVVYIARRFSVPEFGLLSFGIAVNAYVFVISSFGLPIFGSRSIANSATVSRKLLLEVFCVRMALAIAATLTSIALLSLVPSINRQELWLVATFGLSNIPLAGLFDWAFQGLHRQDISATLNITCQAFWLFLTVVGVRLGVGLVVVPIALSASSLIAAAVGYLWLRRIGYLEPATERRSPLLRGSWETLRATTPLGWGILLITLLVWGDSIVVRVVSGESAVGIYAAGNRAALALAMLGSFYVQGAFPLLSRTSHESQLSFEHCVRRTHADLAMLFVPLSCWATYYTREIIQAVFGRPDYLAAVPVFRIFQGALLLYVANNLLGTGVLLAHHRDKIFRRVLVGTALVFSAVCPVFTWLWTIRGAAAAVLVSQFVSFVWFYREARPFAQIHISDLLWPFVAGLSAVAACHLLHLSLLTATLPMGLAYLVLLYFRNRGVAAV